MKTLASIALLLTPCLSADEAADRAAIEGLVTALNNGVAQVSPQLVSPLFSAESKGELDRLIALHGRLLQASRAPMSEVTPPRFAVQGIRFLTSDFAVADAAITQFGSLVLNRVPLLFLMHRSGDSWRIASVRTVSDPAPAPRLVPVESPR